MLVCYRAHYRADSQAVEIIVNEYQHAQQECRKLRPHAGLDVRGSPFAVSTASTCLVHEHDDHAEDYQEHENSHIVGIREICDKAVLDDHCEHSLKAGIVRNCIDDAACQDTDEQRGINLFCYQRKTDGNDWRQQRPQRADCFSNRRLNKAPDQEQQNKCSCDEFSDVFFHGYSPFF